MTGQTPEQEGATSTPQPRKKDSVAGFAFDAPSHITAHSPQTETATQPDPVPSTPLPKAMQTTVDPSDPIIGQQVGDYLIEKRLSQSDRTDVYLAYHKELGTPVAIKFLKGAFSRLIQPLEEQFFSMAAERARVQHPNVLRLHESGKYEGRYYLVTEFVEGSRLEDILNHDGAFDAQRAMETILQLCNALDEIHSKGIGYCGVNPFNTLVDKTGIIKASVFGVGSVLAAQGISGVEDQSPEATQYLAPEQAKGAPIESRSDIYSLGCMLYRFICGRAPYSGSSFDEIIKQHAESPVADPRNIVPAIPKEVSDIAIKMMAKNPDDRYASIRETMIAIQSACGESGHTAAANEPMTSKVSYKGLERLLVKMHELGSSDLHIKLNTPPVYRIRGETRPLNAPPFTPDQIKALVYEVLSADQIESLKQNKSIDISLGIDGVGRFRANIYYQRTAISACIRAVSSEIPTMDQLLLPRAIANISTCKNGLVLVSGATGSGKSTTLACIIDIINQTRRNHIITIEDPIEYVHRDKASIVSQREIGIDTPDFLAGLRDAMRQDPDVILLGELRDSETMETAMHASETGHLVLGTLHARSTTDALVRLLNFFPHEMHEMLRHNLGNSLRSIIAQKLVPGIRQEFPRVPAIELLLVNPVIRQCIQDNEDERIPKQFQVFVQEGMQSFNMSLYTLVTKGFVDRNIALQESPNPKELQSMFGTTVR